MINTFRTKISTFVRAVVFFALAGYFSFAAAGTVSAQGLGSAYDWYIQSFDGDITLHEDGSFTVVETIDVSFSPSVPKHGIVRTIPYKYKTEAGTNTSIDLDIISVLQDGSPATVDISRSSGDYVLKIGDADRTIVGRHQYQIQYRVERALLFADEATTLYWNVTGDEWSVPILESSAAVHVPEGVDVLASACYTGAFGSTNQDCGIVEGEGVVAFAAEDFLTVSIDIPAGVIEPPGTMTQFFWTLQDQWPASIPLALMILMGVWWKKKGRDPKSNKTVIAQYDPPDELWALPFAFLLYGRKKQRFITAAIIQLAVKGYLEIDVQGSGKKKKLKDITLRKLRSADGLDKAHTLLFEGIFRGKDTVRLDALKGKIQPSLMTTITANARKQLVERGYVAKHSAGRRVVGIALGAILLFASPYFFTAFGAVSGALFALGGLVVGVFGWLMHRLTPAGVEARWKAKGFEEFLYTADRYRSEWQERENIFSEFLPYAIASKHVKQWAKAFEGMEQSPDWYHSSDAFVYGAFISQMNQVTHSVSRATTPVAPSSSGGSSTGGGFSGGGFGGGGGSSW